MYAYEVVEVQGGWKLRLLENGEEVGSGVWGDDDNGYSEAVAEGELWVMSHGYEHQPGHPMFAEQSVPAGASELLVELLMVRRLIARPQGRESLCCWMGCSVATLKRRIDDVRGLGAHVESVKAGDRWVYHVANADLLEPRLSRWIELEQQRSLVEVNHG